MNLTGDPINSISLMLQVYYNQTDFHLSISEVGIELRITAAMFTRNFIHEKAVNFFFGGRMVKGGLI